MQIPMLGELLSLLWAGVLRSFGIGKPSKDIFLHLLKTYGLQPEETFFIDDSAKNVAGAQFFDGDATKLRNYLKL